MATTTAEQRRARCARAAQQRASSCAPLQRGNTGLELVCLVLCSGRPLARGSTVSAPLPRAERIARVCLMWPALPAWLGSYLPSFYLILTSSLRRIQEIATRSKDQVSGAPWRCCGSQIADEGFQATSAPVRRGRTGPSARQAIAALRTRARSTVVPASSKTYSITEPVSVQCMPSVIKGMRRCTWVKMAFHV